MHSLRRSFGSKINLRPGGQADSTGEQAKQCFLQKTWNRIRDEFNKQTDLNFNNNQLRKHLDVLRMRFNNLKYAYNQNDFAIEDSCCIVFDLWEDIAAQPRPDTIKVKDCPIYDQLSAIFIDSSANGKYAQSSHFEGLDKSVGNSTMAMPSGTEGSTQHHENPSSSRLVQGNSLSSEKVTKNTAEKKRKRSSERHSSLGQSRRDEKILEGMAGALQEMIAASKLREAVMTV